MHSSFLSSSLQPECLSSFVMEHVQAESWRISLVITSARLSASTLALRSNCNASSASVARCCNSCILQSHSATCSLSSCVPISTNTRSTILSSSNSPARLTRSFTTDIINQLHVHAHGTKHIDLWRWWWYAHHRQVMAMQLHFSRDVNSWLGLL